MSPSFSDAAMNCAVSPKAQRRKTNGIADVRIGTLLQPEVWIKVSSIIPFESRFLPPFAASPTCKTVSEEDKRRYSVTRQPCDEGSCYHQWRQQSFTIAFEHIWVDWIVNTHSVDAIGIESVWLEYLMMPNRIPTKQWYNKCHPGRSPSL